MRPRLHRFGRTLRAQLALIFHQPFVRDAQPFRQNARQPQGKLINVTAGEIFDVAVDLRRASPTFGKWTATNLSGGTHRMVWIPPGFAHGFLVLSEHALVHYKASDYYAPQHERTLLWNDPALGIAWPLEGEPIVSDKDRRGALLRSADLFD